MNVLSLISQRLNNYYQIKTKRYSIATVRQNRPAPNPDSTKRGQSLFHRCIIGIARCVFPHPERFFFLDSLYNTPACVEFEYLAFFPLRQKIGFESLGVVVFRAKDRLIDGLLQSTSVKILKALYTDCPFVPTSYLQ